MLLTVCRSAIIGGMLTLLMLIATACGGGNGAKLETVSAAVQLEQNDPTAELPAIPVLPPPSSLTAAADDTRQGAAAPGDWRSQGSDIASGLPSNRVLAGVTTATFSPQWTNGDPLNDLAYACHEFLLPEYDFGDYVQLDWVKPPADGQLYIALSDWQRDTWRWYSPESAELLRPQSLLPHYDENGRLLLVLAVIGTETANLNWISIGNRPPEAVVEVVGPSIGFGSLNATFDPSGSFDTDGSIVKYEWDWEDDGSFDQISGNGPVQHQFTEEGSHTVRLRVTDNLGRRDGAPVAVSVGKSWVRTIGGPEEEFIEDIAIAPDGSIWACGTVLTGLKKSELAVLHFDAAGQLLYENYWKISEDPEAGHAGLGIAVDANGFAYVLAQTLIEGVTSNVIQRYHPVGELSWSRQISATNGILEDILIAGEQIFVCGGRWDALLSASRGIYLVLDLDGNGIYARLSNEAANFNSMAWHHEELLGDELRLCGSVLIGINTDLLHASIKFGDPFEYSAYTWGSQATAEFSSGIALHDTGTEVLSMLACSLYIDVDNERSTVVRFGNDEGVSCSMDTSITRARDVVVYGDDVFTLSENSPGVTSIQHYNTVPGFDGAHGYTASLLTSPECMESFGNLALAVGGSAVNNTGNFAEETVSNFQLEDQPWTEYALSYDFHVFTVEETNLPNISTRQPGTQDSGGGGQDFWLSLHVPPQIDF